LYLLLSSDYFTKIQYVIQLKEDKLILDYPAFVNSPQISVNRMTVSFNEISQVMIIENYENVNIDNNTLLPMKAYTDENPSYEKIIKQFDEQLQTNRSIKLIFDGNKFIYLSNNYIIMTKVLTFISILFLFSFSTFGQVDKEYSKTLKKMFEVSGTNESYQAAIQQMFTMFKQQYPDVGEEIWNDFEKEFSKTSIDELTEMLVPIYSKYMTKEDLKELIKFYQTPVGKKFAKNTPFIMQESMQVGQEWGMKIGEEFEKKMKARGY
jgi:hypothetical protein